LGLLFGFTAITVGFHWIAYTIHVFGGVNYALAVVGLILFSLYTAIPFALFAILVRKCGLGPLALWPAVFWVAVEFWFPNLFPWYLASSQSLFAPLIQSADVVGLHGTSFVLVWFNAVLFKLLRSFKGPGTGRLPVWDVVALGSVVIAVIVYGQIRIEQVTKVMAEAPRLEVAAVQGNISIGRKDKTAFLKTNLTTYKNLSLTVPNVDLLIWPESALESWVPEGAARLPVELLPPTHPPMIVGSMSFRRERTHNKSFNSAFLVDRDGKVLGRYHKQILLAFGEYIPFAWLIGDLPGMPPIGNGFTPGDLNDTFNIAGARAAPLICYEDLMPWLARRFVNDRGANLLVNITNDAWYGHSVAPWQHARLAQWRTIETRRAMIRSTNTGITTVIEPTGEIKGSLPIFSEGVFQASVPLLEMNTLYARYGDWFAYLLTGIALLAVAKSSISGRQSELIA
jgi:apolipoprotein N-acyltransferase